MTSVSGAVVWSAKYESFGKTVIDSSSTIENNLCFPGQYYDQETGFHYNYHRFYDPGTGRYMTTDPLGLAAQE
jgi:large repetitive protein